MVPRGERLLPCFLQRAAPGVMVDPLMGAFSGRRRRDGQPAVTPVYLRLRRSAVASWTDAGPMGPAYSGQHGHGFDGAGVATFAFADNIWIAYIGRFAIGAGSAVAFISALTRAAWHAPSRFGMFSGMTMGYAMLGGFRPGSSRRDCRPDGGWREPLGISALWAWCLPY